jgi:hypothetical protein
LRLIVKAVATAIGLCILAVGLWVGGRQIASVLFPTYDIKQSNPKRTDDQNDQEVLTLLGAKGADLSKRTDVVFYLYIPLIQDARAAASKLDENGFVAEVEKPLGRLPDGSYESRYSVVAHIEQVPSMANLRKDRALYKSLARQYRGDYDGWEAAVAH